VPAPIPASLVHTFRHAPELVVGRTAAACVHPVAAWRVLPTSWRVLVLMVYTATGYLTVLSALIVMEP
jgi:hypothetical protein